MRLENTLEGYKTRKQIGWARCKFMDDYTGSTSSQSKALVKQTAGNERTFCMENWASGQ